MQKLLFTDRYTVRCRALFLGERLDLRDLEKVECLAKMPLVVTAGEHGCAVLFRYGVVVLFGLGPVEEVSFLTYLKPLIVEPFAAPETEEAELSLESAAAGRVENGTIWIQEFSTEYLQIVADVLAKSVVLAHYEAGTAGVFDQIEPFAAGLQRTTKNERWGKELLRQLGTTLSIQHKIVGRVEIIDKPELLWDLPHLERLYLRLEDEYEIRERHSALERKLDLISRTAETVLDLLQHNSGLRVEWYVVVLIVVEILLSLYDIFFQP
ncbi:MAG TPA: RMD1 family protein [Crinalium sp.]